MNASDLRKKTETELTETLRELKREYEKAVTEIFQNKEKNIKKPGLVKKDIARVKTVLNERKSGIMADAENKGDKKEDKK